MPKVIKTNKHRFKLKRFDECPHGMHGMLEDREGDYVKVEDVNYVLDQIYRHLTDGNEAKVLDILDLSIQSTGGYQ